jgi:hypothetical protein
MTGDAARNQVVLFGGNASGGTVDDTWTWDGSDWTRQSPTHRPVARYLHGMAYDASGLVGHAVLFGGRDRRFARPRGYLDVVRLGLGRSFPGVDQAESDVGTAWDRGASQRAGVRC